MHRNTVKGGRPKRKEFVLKFLIYFFFFDFSIRQKGLFKAEKIALRGPDVASGPDVAPTDQSAVKLLLLFKVKMRKF